MKKVIVEKDFQLQQLDTCLPDYFRGYHAPVMQVSVWSEITGKEVKEAIIDEYNTIWDHLTYGDNGWPDFTDDELIELVNEFILVSDDEPVYKETKELPSIKDYEDDDMMDSVYLFICLEVSD